MATVKVIFTAKERGRFIQQGGGNGGEVFRHPVKLLVNVGFHQMKHASLIELIGLRVVAILCKPVGVLVNATTGIFGKRGAQLHDLP
ncbi:Uncharacterised protein [Enterobacter cloacae]|nr:Uncharacterised protein [Enterobacter cloacae]